MSVCFRNFMYFLEYFLKVVFSKLFLLSNIISVIERLSGFLSTCKINEGVEDCGPQPPSVAGFMHTRWYDGKTYTTVVIFYICYRKRENLRSALGSSYWFSANIRIWKLLTIAFYVPLYYGYTKNMRSYF